MVLAQRERDVERLHSLLSDFDVLVVLCLRVYVETVCDSDDGGVEHAGMGPSE